MHVGGQRKENRTCLRESAGAAYKWKQMFYLARFQEATISTVNRSEFPIPQLKISLKTVAKCANEICQIFNLFHRQQTKSIYLGYVRNTCKKVSL